MSSDPNFLSGLASPTAEMYRCLDFAVFRKTSETWGQYSNMAGGFPVTINGIHILTSEALYQACRFPHRPEVQRETIGQASPMAAKMKGKPHRKNSRRDLRTEGSDHMVGPPGQACLQLPGLHPYSVGQQGTTDRRGQPQGRILGSKATAGDSSTLVGQNVLGRLVEALANPVGFSEAVQAIHSLGREADFCPPIVAMDSLARLAESHCSGE